MTTQQHINCKVTSCRHNDTDKTCRLDAITVSPCHGCSSGSPEDESMCSDYRVR